MQHKLALPLGRDAAHALCAGDTALLTGALYTARDAAHKRLCEMLARGEAPPFPLADAAVYYAGPAPARPGQVIGSAGPTTSGRMDAYTPALLSAGLLAMVGKGARSPAVIEAMVKHGAVYFAAIGGAGALLAARVRRCACVAFEDLGPEAIYRLEVDAFPVTVAIDAAGRNWYSEGPKAYVEWSDKHAKNP